MNSRFVRFFYAVMVMLFVLNMTVFAQSGKNCVECHSEVHNGWVNSHHASTQKDVASELAEEWSGVSPDSVIHGHNAENCIACHSPLSVTVNGGMSDDAALGYFFSTTGDGLFCDTTQSLNEDQWPHVGCESCHQVEDDHPSSKPKLAIFNSTERTYESIDNSNALCGQCHGSLRFEDTDHLRYDAWKGSEHGHGIQNDLVSKFSTVLAGKSSEEVIAMKNCIACHAPTAVNINGGVSEADALEHFFTMEDGKFTANTAPADTNHWEEISCAACHNPMHPEKVSYFNSSTRKYQEMDNSQVLCGQCHGDLRFPNSARLTYNMISGSGGIGVPDTLTMPGASCVDCHMHSGEDGSRSSMLGGHSWDVFVKEENGEETASCTNCHSSLNINKSKAIVKRWQDDFKQKEQIAAAKIEQADSILEGSSDSLKLRYLDEAHHNLKFVQSDESAGFHNHKYAMLLLDDVIDKADYILTGMDEKRQPIPKKFGLQQNYPNPFNSGTVIPFYIAESGYYTLRVYSVDGKLVKNILDKYLQTQKYRVKFDAGNISSGVYYYELRGKKRRDIKKLVLMK